MIKSAIFLSAALVVCAVPAAAEPAFEPVSGFVAVRDLDFAQPSDLARFEQRVRVRARSLCNMGGQGDLGIRRGEKACRSGVMASAQGELTKLVAMAEARSVERLASR